MYFLTQIETKIYRTVIFIADLNSSVFCWQNLFWKINKTTVGTNFFQNRHFSFWFSDSFLFRKTSVFKSCLILRENYLQVSAEEDWSIIFISNIALFLCKILFWENIERFYLNCFQYVKGYFHNISLRNLRLKSSSMMKDCPILSKSFWKK